MKKFYEEQIKHWEWAMYWHQRNGNAREFERCKNQYEAYKQLLENDQVNVPFEVQHG
jgi:N-dimethylarginine dimethylaminohydrolase